jgi:hypothetical protein
MLARISNSPTRRIDMKVSQLAELKTEPQKKVQGFWKRLYLRVCGRSNFYELPIQESPRPDDVMLIVDTSEQASKKITLGELKKYLQSN